MASYEATTMRARLHRNGRSFSLVPVESAAPIFLPHFNLADSEYGREMAKAICDAVRSVNRKHNVRHFCPDGTTERWTSPGCA